MPHLVLWAERADIVYLTVDIADAAPEANFTEEKIDFSATGKDGKVYAFTLEFNKAIDTTGTIIHATPRNIKYTLKKKQGDDWWGRLTKGSKPRFVSTDFALWKDEDDEDDEPEVSPEMGDMGGMGGMGGMPGMGGMGGMPGMGGMDLQALMAQMGQGGGAPGMDFGGADSDEELEDVEDDDVPALETTEEAK
ncbi:Prostaglandin E synthase 3 (Cytosolic) [Podila verticillata]|nr:Prostaglandin E synthase 3 (Cytosolic) [Podila verticillata]